MLSILLLAETPCNFVAARIVRSTGLSDGKVLLKYTNGGFAHSKTLASVKRGIAERPEYFVDTALGFVPDAIKSLPASLRSPFDNQVAQADRRRSAGRGRHGPTRDNGHSPVPRRRGA